MNENINSAWLEESNRHAERLKVTAEGKAEKRRKAVKTTEGKYSGIKDFKLSFQELKQTLKTSSFLKGVLAVFKWIFRLVYILFRSLWRVLIGIAAMALVAILAVAIGIGYLYFTSAEELPAIENYEQISMPQDSTIYDIDGEIIGVISTVKREYVGFGEISQPMKDAIVSIEDERFYNHSGVDYYGIARAVYVNFQEWRSGGDFTKQGASTITQQYVRNAYEKVGNEQTFSRKLTEMMLAAQLELSMSKDDILNNYLNTIYFGNGCYGVEAASKHYFGHSADTLDYYESAILASIVKGPSVYDPEDEEGSGQNDTVQRANLVLDKMYSLGKLGNMTQEELRDLKATNIKDKLNITYNDKVINHPYYYDYVMKELMKDYTTEQIDSGGWQIYTTLSIADGREADAVVTGIEEKYDYNGITAAIADVDVETGALHAFCGGLNYEESQYNIATQAHLQTGSTLKPILYAALCEYNGYYMSDNMSCEPINIGTENQPHVIEPYIPASSATLKQGLIASDNAMAIHAAQELGMDKMEQMMRSLGIESEVEDNVVYVIGGQTTGVTPLEMASAYSAFPRKGQSIKIWCVKTISDSFGNLIYDREQQGGFADEEEQVHHEQTEDATIETKTASTDDSQTKTYTNYALSEEVSNQVIDAMKAAVDEAGWYNIPFDKQGWTIAAKTGTTNDDMDSWCVGFDHNRSVAIWVGGRDGKIEVYNSSYNTTTAFSSYFERVGQKDIQADFTAPQYKTEVPKLEKGMNLDDYTRVVQQKQLAVETQYVTVPDTDEMTIVGVVNEGSLVNRGGSAVVKVSKDMTTIPDFVGMSPAQAYNAALGLNISFDVNYATSGNSQPTITAQSIAEGEMVPSGSNVTLEVTMLVDGSSNTQTNQVPFIGSDNALHLLQNERDALKQQNEELIERLASDTLKLEEIGQFQVPNVVGLTASEAKQVLSSVGLRYTYTGNNSDEISSMSPVAGSIVSQSDKITLKSSSSSSTSDSSSSSSPQTSPSVPDEDDEQPPSRPSNNQTSSSSTASREVQVDSLT